MRYITNTQINELLRLMYQNRYYIATRMFEVNMVGVRVDSVIPNIFDDVMYVFYKNQSNNWEGVNFAITSDPGTYWLRNPMMPQGTAILKRGQYPYKIGTHNDYRALVQRGEVTVIRDHNRDNRRDYDNGREEKGMFQINIHRAKRVGTTVTVDKNSAGCQVFANADDFAYFMELVSRSVKMYGDKTLFYTLFDYRVINRLQPLSLASI